MNTRDHGRWKRKNGPTAVETNPVEDEFSNPDMMVDSHAAARFLRVTEVTMRRWRSKGCGPDFKRIGRTIRYRVGNLISFARDDK